MSKRPRASLILRLTKDRSGATAIEYGFILALITLASMAALIEMSGTVVGIWSSVAAKVTAAS